MSRVVSISFAGNATDANRASESVERGLEGVSRQAVTTKAALANVWGSDADAKRFSASVAGAGSSLGGLSGNARDVNRGFELMRNVMGLLKWPALITGAGFAAQALSALAGGAVALAGALGPLTGLLAAIPAGLGAVVASAVTVKLAFKDMKEALAGNADAIKRLTPEARAFAETLKGLTPIITELRKAAQQGLFPGLEQALKTVLTKENLAAVKAGLTGVGQALGDAAVSIAKVLGTKQFAADLNLLFKQFESIIRAAGVAGGFFATALVNIMVSAKPLIDFLNQSLIAFARWTAETTTAGRATGDLQKFFEGTVATMKQLGAILGPLGSALINIFKAAKPLTDAILKDLGAVTAKFKEWTASASGQNSIAKYFTDIKEPLYEMARLVRDVVKAFFELGTQPGLTSLVRQIRVELLPAIVTLISTTTQTLGPALVTLFTNAAKLMTQLAGATGPLIALVKILGGLAGALADFLAGHDELRNMVTSFASMVAISKAISFAAAITGARALATSLGLVSASSKASAGAIVSSSAAEVAALRAVSAQAGLTTLALRGVSTSAGVASIAAIGSTGRLTTALGGTRLAASRVGLAFGPWGIAIATAIAIGIPYLDKLNDKLKEIEPRLGRLLDYSGGDFLRDIGKGLARTPGPLGDLFSDGGGGGGTTAPGSSGDRAAGSRTGGLTTPGTRSAGNVALPTFGTSALYGQHGGGGRTTGLEDWGPTAHDFMANAGAAVLAPEDGHVTDERPFNSTDRGLWGAAIYYQGTETGALYYIKHIMRDHAAVGSSHRRGDVIAYVASGTQGGPHAHVGVDPTGTGMGTPLDVDGGNIDVAPTKAQLAFQKVIGGLKDTASGLSDDIPEITKSLVPKLQAMYDALGDKRLSEKALAAIKASGADLRHALSNLISGDELRDKIPNLRATIGAILDDDSRNALRKRADELGALFRKFFKDGVISDAELATLRAKTKALNAAITEAFSKDTLDRVKELRGDLNRLFAAGFIDDESLAKAQAALDKIPAMLKRFMADGVIGPKERAALAKQLSIADEIVKAGEEAEEAAERAFGKVRETFRKLFADGVVSDADLALLSKAVAGIGGKIGIGLQEAVAAVEKGRQDFDAAWASFRSAIEAAFREQVIGKFQLTIDFADVELAFAQAESDLWDAKVKFGQLTEFGLDPDAVNAAATKLKDTTDALAKQKRELADAIADLATLSGAAAAKAQQLAQDLADAQADYAALGAKATEKQIREALQRIEKLQAQLASISDDIEDKTIRDAAQKVGDLTLAVDKAQIAFNKATAAAAGLTGALDAESQMVADAINRVVAANKEYYDAIISQDRERIKAAVAEKVAANSFLLRLETDGMGERAQAILSAGQTLISAEETIGRALVDEQKRIWEETKTVALAGVLAVVDDVALRLRDGKITWAQAVGEIGTALTAAGMDAGSAADLLGQNVSGSMGKAAQAIVAAIDRMVKAMQDLVRAMGGAVTDAKKKHDEVAGWERALQVRSEALNKKYATEIAAAQANQAKLDAAANQAAASSQAANPQSTMGPSPNVDYSQTPGYGQGSGAPTGPAAPAPSSSTYQAPASPPPASQNYYAPPPPPSSPSPPANDPYVPPPYDPGPGAPPGYGDTYYAEGGVAWNRILAHVGEKWPEAMIPMPPTMPPSLRALLVHLAKGGWRRPPVPRRLPRPDAARGFGLTASGGPGAALTSRLEAASPGLAVLPGGGVGYGSGVAAGSGGGDRGQFGPPAVHITIPVSIDAGILTSERDLGAEIAEIATPAIRDALLRVGERNPDIFGGRA